MAHDCKTGRQSFRAVEFPWPPVIDAVGCDEVREKALALATDFAERDVVETRPGTFDDCSAEFFQEVFISIGNNAGSVWSSKKKLLR